MIKISKNSSESRFLIFVSSNFLSEFVLMYWIVFARFHVVEVLIGGIFIIINSVLSWRLAFNDSEIWLDSANRKVLLKKGSLTDSYDTDEFFEFGISSFGMILSDSWRFYRLRIGNKTYRIRYYIARLKTINDIFDPKIMLKEIADDIIREIDLRLIN